MSFSDAMGIFEADAIIERISVDVDDFGRETEIETEGGTRRYEFIKELRAKQHQVMPPRDHPVPAP